MNKTQHVIVAPPCGPDSQLCAKLSETVDDLPEEARGASRTGPEKGERASRTGPEKGERASKTGLEEPERLQRQV